MAIKERDPFFDNARFLLVFLVVLGHFVSPIRSDYLLLQEVNNFIGLFRMPALILVTGYFAKSFNKPGYIEKITKKILVPYLIFQFFIGLYYYNLYDYSVFNFDFLQPQYTLWYMLSLFIWNMLLFIFTKIKYPLLFAVLIGVLIGYSENAGGYLSIQRTLTFFPFFLIGFYLKKEHFGLLKLPKAKIISAVVLVFVWWSFYNLFDTAEAERWITGVYSYSAMNYIRFDIGLVQLIVYALSLLGGIAFLTFIPKRKTFFTSLGTKTAYIYILHAVIIRTFYEYYFADMIQNSNWHMYMVPLYALVLTLVLGSKPIVFLTRPFIEGKIIDYLMKPLRFLIKISKRNNKVIDKISNLINKKAA